MASSKKSSPIPDSQKMNVQKDTNEPAIDLQYLNALKSDIQDEHMLHSYREAAEPK